MACEQVTLQDVCELIVDCPHTSAKDEGVGYPLIRTPNVGRGRLILTDVHRVSQDVYERRVSRAVPRQGDLILAREAPAGNVAIVSPGIEVCLGQRTMLLRPDSSFVVPEYLNYYLNAPEQRDRMLRLANGATVSHINVADIRNMPVQLPSRGEQSKVAELLNVLDDKIDLNNRLNDYLANLLDAAFANSAKSGSKEFGLPEVVDILSGGTPKTKNAEYWEDGRIPFFTPGDVTNSVYTLTTEKHITDVGLDNCNSELYPVDTVFLTARGTVGKVAIAGRPMAMNQSCFAFRGKSIPQSVVFQIIKNAVKTLRAKANGATFAAINTRDLKIETVAVPCNKEIAHYDESASKWLDLIRTNEEENLQLSALRDILLPKLMSGEIDVSKVDLTQLTNNHLADY